MVRTSDRSKADHVGTHHQHQQTHSHHPSQIFSKGSQATQLYLAPQLMLFQSFRSPKAHWKTSTSCQGSQLGIPSAFPFICQLHMHYLRTRDSWPSHLQSSETLFWQYKPMPLLLLVRTLPGTHPSPWSVRQNWPIMHPISTTSTEPCVTKSNSFASSSSLIQASNGKHPSPI